MRCVRDACGLHDVLLAHTHFVPEQIDRSLLEADAPPGSTPPRKKKKKQHQQQQNVAQAGQRSNGGINAA